MSTNSKLFIALNFVFMIVLFSLLFNQQKAWEKKQILGMSKSYSTGAVTVSASIGNFRFTLDGYSSPGALVTIQGMGIYDQTFANRDGYFQFSNSFSPFSPREACLTAQDQLGRLTSPVCLPPFSTNRNITIGPVILPPTVSLDKDVYYVGDEAILSGQSIPNSEINLSTFTKRESKRNGTPKQSRPSRDATGQALNGAKVSSRGFAFLPFPFASFSVIPSVSAATIPQLTFKTDAKGNYSVALPSSSDEAMRLFTQTKYNEQPSAQSINLNIKIWPVWMMVINFFKLIFLLLKPRLLELIILVQLIGLIIYLLRRFLHPHVLARQRTLMIRLTFPLMVEN